MQPNNIIQFVPNKNSGTASWVAYYNQLEARYGKKNAQAALAITWEKRGGSKVDLDELGKVSGMTFDKTFLSGVKSYAADAISFATTSQRTVMMIGIGIGVLLALGVTYRIITASAEEVGTASGTAIKAII
jgi:hypothetical protein